MAVYLGGSNRLKVNSLIIKGNDESYNEGYSVGHENGITEGKKAEYDAFWNAFQQDGERVDYGYAFRSAGWNNNNFKPKYDIVAENCTQMFASTGITDVAECLKQAGVTLDTSRSAGFSYTFYSDCIEALPVVNTVSASKLSYTFYNAKKLHTIEKLVLKSDGSQTFESAFGSCSLLQNIIIEGCVGNNISFSSSSKLTHESLISIINALKDYSGDSSGTVRKCTIGNTNKSKLTGAELLIAKNKGWTVE